MQINDNEKIIFKQLHVKRHYPKWNYKEDLIKSYKNFTIHGKQEAENYKFWQKISFIPIERD
jgi:hypothetical protein